MNAAGAWAPRLLPGLPIVPRKGHLVITDRYPGFLRHQVIELGYLKSAHALTRESVAFNVQPRRTGQLLIGSSRELVGWDDSLNGPLRGRMLRRATEYLPALAQPRALRTWVGFRPATPDGLPLVGMWEPGLWVAAGHEGLGVTTAPGTAATPRGPRPRPDASDRPGAVRPPPPDARPCLSASASRSTAAPPRRRGERACWPRCGTRRRAPCARR